MKKEETKPKAVKKQLINASFLDKTGKKINVSDVIDESDCWFITRKNTWIIKHDAIKKIAKIAGISQNYDVDESVNILPEYKNELEHIVRVTIHCKAMLTEGNLGVECVHSDEPALTMTGEANKINCPNRGRGYLRKMAEKRAYDIAVLEHLGLYSSVYSEEEASDFEEKREPEIAPGTKDFEFITKEVNAILNSKTIADLKKIGKKIKVGIDIDKYNEKQIVYLRNLYVKEYGQKNKSF